MEKNSNLLKDTLTKKQNKELQNIIVEMIGEMKALKHAINRLSESMEKKK